MMKKLSILLISIFYMSFLMAQNDHDITQLGDHNQIMLFNQNGTDNYAEIVQTMVGSNDHNQVWLNQVGTGNQSYQFQRQATTNLQKADIRQVNGAVDNWARQDQGLDDSGGHQAFIKQDATECNEAYQKQDGSGNYSDIQQSNGANSKAYNQQLGNGNVILVTQIGNNNVSGTSIGSLGIYQYGTNNYAELTQTGDGNNQGTINQIGDDNWVVATQIAP
jgi:uncharacterized protein YrzB (UPF0473 family)